MIQTFGIVSASIPSHKNRRRKVEIEVNLKIAEEIKARGESARWQSDCKPYRTHAVNVISESMN